MNDTARNAYDAWHARLGAEGEVATPWHELVQAHLDPETDLLGKDILEIGCGRGRFACWLAAQSAHPRRLVAMDFSPVAVGKGRALASAQGLNGIDWAVCDIEAIAHADGSFDTVISCETIEHVGDPPRALGELARVLRPGGRLFLTTPNYFGITGLYRFYLRLRGRRFAEAGQPVNNFTFWPRTLRWVWKVGLVVRGIDGAGHYFILPRRPPIRIMALDRVRAFTRWTALHTLIVAEKV